MANQTLTTGTLSSRINYDGGTLFRDDTHCAKAYVSEMEGVQNAKEYR